MTPRERARFRLSRHVPDFAHWQRRDPAHRVGERDQQDDAPPRRVPGDSVVVRDGSGSVRSLQTVEAGPNAPLLMRIVRDPYALTPAEPVRVRWAPASDPADDEPVVRVSDVVREKREALRPGRPVRDIDHRPQVRPHPFARVRERGETP